MAYPFRLTGDYYVNSLSGNDSYAGTKTAPFKTIAKAVTMGSSKDKIVKGYFSSLSVISVNYGSFTADGFCEFSGAASAIRGGNGADYTGINFKEYADIILEGYISGSLDELFNCVIECPVTANDAAAFANPFTNCLILTNSFQSNLQSPFTSCVIYGSGGDFPLYNVATNKDTIISNVNIVIGATAPTLPDYLCFDVSNVSWDLNGTAYAVGEITTKAELQAACVAEYAGSLTDYFDNSFVENPSFKNKTRNVFIPTNENLWTGSSTGSYLGYTDPTGTSIKVEIAAVPDNFYLDYANGENVDAGTDFLFQDLGTSIEFASLTNDVWYIVLADSVTINGTDVYNDGDKYLKKAGDTESAGNQKYKAYNEAYAESNIIYLPVAKKITSLAIFGQNTNNNRNRVDSTPQVSESVLDFAALSNGVDYVVGAGGVTINSTDVYVKGEVYNFTTSDSETTGNPDYFLLTETRETIDLRFRNFDLGTALTTSDTLTANYWYIVTAGVATYNGNSYRKNQSFKCLTGTTSFTGSGAEVKEVFQTDGTGGYHDFQPYAVDLTLSATTTDDDPLEANMSNLQYSNGHALYQAAVDGGKTEHKFYPIYFQDRTKLIIDL